jgi:DDE superfamily endonuclease
VTKVTSEPASHTVPQTSRGELLDWQKKFNTSINKVRYVIERAIAHFKTWRCMHTDYRRPERTYATAFNAVRALHFSKLRFT